MPSSKKNLNWLLLILAGGLVVIVFTSWFTHRQFGPAVQTEIPPVTIASGTNTQPLALNKSAHLPTVSNSRLQAAFDAIRNAKDTTAARPQLDELRAALSAMPTNAAVAAIQQFLDSKTDASTHMGFKVGADGILTEAPTLRTFLLDELGRLDPAAAAEYSKIILASMDSPDEWAVALRNLARGDTSADDRALLEQKTEEMLQYEPWQRNPSVGYLESFDVAVYLGGTSLLPTLSNLVRSQDNPAVAHASFLALDRLVINDPATTLATLQADSALLQGREQTRADYFARANVNDPQQRQVLESYLLNPQTTPAEIDAFAGIFPNDNFMISPNLLTQNQTLDRDALAARDAASLRVVQDWLADPRFANLKPALTKTSLRLQEFINQESTSQ